MEKVKNTIKNTIILAFVIAGLGLLMLPHVAAAGTIAFNSDAADPATVRIANETKGGSWTTNMLADPGDVIKVMVYYHNDTRLSDAINTKIQLSPQNGITGLSHSLSGSVTADNSSNIYPAQNAVLISLPSAESLDYISGSLKWYPNQTTIPVSLPSGQSETSIFGNGLNIGTVQGEYSCPSSNLFCRQGSVILKFQVSGSAQPNPACSDGIDNDNDGQIDYPADDGCTSATDDDETDPPSGSAPTVTTDTVSSITDVSAILNATVNPNGDATTVWFQVDGGGPYCQQSIVSGTSNVTVMCDTTTTSLNPLSPNTSYNVKAIAINSINITDGSPQSFTTLQISQLIPTTSTNASTNITENSATINGSVNPNGSSTNTSFKYGTSQSNLAYTVGMQSIGSGNASVNVSYTLSGLAQNTIYFYQVTATNGVGTNDGGIMSFTTNNPQSNQVPTVATNGATGIGVNQAILNAFINPNGTFTTTYFKYGTSQSNLAYTAGMQSIGSGNASVNVSYTLTGLSEQTLYYFKVCAQNTVGTTCGSILNFRTSPHADPPLPPAGAPTAITSVATLPTGTTAKLNGLVIIDGTISTVARFDYGPTITLGSRTHDHDLGSSGSVSFGHTVRGLNPDTIYFFQAVAQNSKGTSRGDILIFKTGNGSSGTTTNETHDINVLSPISLTIESLFEDVAVGDIVAYTVAYKNISKEKFENAILRVILPDEIVFKKATTGTFSSSDNTLTVEIGDLEKSQNGEISLQGEILSKANRQELLVTTAVLVYADPDSGAQEDVIAYALHNIEKGENGNLLAAAAIFGAYGFPNSLLEWIILILIVTGLVFLGRRFYLKSQKDKGGKDKPSAGQKKEEPAQESFGAFNAQMGGAPEGPPPVIE